MSNIEYRVVKKKKLDKELTLRVLKNDASARIYVEFSLDSSTMVLQKSFQDTFAGRKEAETFQDTIKTGFDLKRYFGVV